MLLAVLLALSAAPVAQLLTLPETLVVRALLLPVLLLEGVRWFRAGHLLRPVPLALLLAATGLMSQVPPPAPDSVRPAEAAPPFGAPPLEPATPAEVTQSTVIMDSPQEPLAAPYTTLSVGAVGGESIQLYGVQSSCNPTYPDITTLPGYRQRQWNAAFGVARTWARPSNVGDRRTVTFGIDAGVGGVRNTPRNNDGLIYFSDPYDSNRANFQRFANPGLLYSFSPHIELEVQKSRGGRVRSGIGFQVGRLAYDYVDAPGRSRKFLPILLFEVGPPRIVYLHASTYRGLNGVGNGSWWLGLGHSFGHGRVEWLAGVAEAHSNRRTQWEIFNFGGTSADFSSPGSWFTEVQVAAGPRCRLTASGQSNFNDATRVAASVHYRLTPPATQSGR